MYCVIPGLIRYTDTVESVESGTPRDQDNAYVWGRRTLVSLIFNFYSGCLLTVVYAE
jgi:hypothetical protein